MTTTKGFLIECEGRSLFLREKKDVQWAIEDDNYTVTELVPKPKLYEQAIEESSGMDAEAVKEQLSMMNDLFLLEEKEIQLLKDQLSEFVEAVESIREICTPTQNFIENRAKLLLIAETCGNLLKSRE